MVRAAAKNLRTWAWSPRRPTIRRLRSSTERVRSGRHPASACPCHVAHTAAHDAAIGGLVDGAARPPVSRRRHRAEWLDDGARPRSAADPAPHARHGPRCSATGRTRTSRAPATGSGTRAGGTAWSSTAATALSYLNIFDGDAAWRLVHELAADAGAAGTAVAIIKHANPCGAAVAGDLVRPSTGPWSATRLRLRWRGGPRPDRSPLELADAIAAGPQADVIIAPSFAPGRRRAPAARRKATRLLSAPVPEAVLRQLRSSGASAGAGAPTVSSPPHGVAVASPPADPPRTNGPTWCWPGGCADARRPTPSRSSMTARRSASAPGSSPGWWRPRSRSRRRVRRAKGAAGASDAFFPFPDGLLVLAEAGCGGGRAAGWVGADADWSRRPPKKPGLAMVMTGERHFRH